MNILSGLSSSTRRKAVMKADELNQVQEDFDSSLETPGKNPAGSALSEENKSYHISRNKPAIITPSSSCEDVNYSSAVINVDKTLNEEPKREIDINKNDLTRMEEYEKEKINSSEPVLISEEDEKYSSDMIEENIADNDRWEIESIDDDEDQESEKENNAKPRRKKGGSKPAWKKASTDFKNRPKSKVPMPTKKRKPSQVRTNYLSQRNSSTQLKSIPKWKVAAKDFRTKKIESSIDKELPLQRICPKKKLATREKHNKISARSRKFLSKRDKEQYERFIRRQNLGREMAAEKARVVKFAHTVRD